MRLRAATLRNYRMHRELTVRFDPARTVIGGPNEAGKSTLVEAIHRTLFFRHKSDVGLDDVRSRSVSAPPEVVVEFEAAGRTYTLHKVFNGPRGSSAALADDAGQRLTGDEAEQRLHELLGVGQLAANQMRRLLEQWSHLWVWQGTAADDPTSPELLHAAAERLRKRLTTLAGTGLTESARDSAAYDRVSALHAATFVNSGRDPRAGSDLHAARQELAAARTAASQARAQLEAFQQAAATVALEDESIRSRAATFGTATVERERIAGTVAEIERLEGTLEDRKAAAAAAATEYDACAAGDAEIRRVGDEITALRGAVAPQEEEVTRLVAHEHRARTAAADAAASLKRAFDAHNGVLAEQALLQALGRAFELASRRTDLEAIVTQVEAHEAGIDAIDARLRGLPAIDADEVAEVDDLDRRLAVARASLQAIATRVELLRTAEDVALDGRPLAAGTERTLTEAAELVVGTAAIRITPGGGQSLADVRASVAGLESELRRRLGELGVPTAAEARRVHDERAAAQAARDRHTDMITALDGDEVKSRLRRVNEDIGVIEADIGRRMPAGFVRPHDAPSASALLDAVNEGCRREAQAVQRAQEEFERAGRAAASARTQREQAEAELAARRVELQRLAWDKERLENTFGLDREAALEDLASVKTRAEAAVTEINRALAALSPEEARADLERLDLVLEVTAREMTEARERLAEARGQLRHAGTVDLHGARAAADARLELAERRHAEIDRRAQAIRRLRQLFEARRQAVAARLAEPLRAKVAEYLDALYGAGSRVAVTLTDRGFQDLLVTRPAAGGLEFKFEALSGGTREQVAAACRLAMAELLAGEADGAGGDGCLPMVFDDAFTNSDPERIQAVQRVLYLGARRGLQIIVLSCNPHEYGLLGASHIDLPPARHEGAPGVAPRCGRGGPATGDGDDRDADGDPGDAVDPAVDAPRDDGSAGAVPLGDDDALAAELLTVLESLDERGAGNKALRERLGWDEATYERIKERLVGAGRLERGRGRGGSVRLTGAGAGDDP